MFDGYDKGMGVQYVSHTHTQFRRPNSLNFRIFEKEKAHISDKNNTSGLSRGWNIKISYFSLIPYNSSLFQNNLQHII